MEHVVYLKGHDDQYVLARKVLLYYAKRGYVVALARQDLGLPSKPDLVTVSADKSTWIPLYSKAM